MKLSTTSPLPITVEKHPDTPVIIIGDFNANLENPTTERDIEISTYMSQLQLRDPIFLFKQKKHTNGTHGEKVQTPRHDDKPLRLYNDPSHGTHY